MAKPKITPKSIKRNHAARERLMQETERKHMALILMLQGLIARGELIIWLPGKGPNGVSLLVNAADVDVNGSAIQIMAEPDWRKGLD